MSGRPRRLGLRCHYQLIEIADAGREELKLLLEGGRRLGAGINVTFPDKEALLGLLDELSPDAARIGAVNTVVVRDNRLIGYNTDTTGFARAVTELIGASSHGPVAVIGAGGVGKAIAFALAGLGVRELRLFDREPAKAADRPQGLKAG
jgi:shikimate dehydrogenase